jgi:hypothetical protein
MAVRTGIPALKKIEPCTSRVPKMAKVPNKKEPHRAALQKW